MSSSGFYRLRQRLGLYSKFAGLGFIGLAVLFLVLAAYDQFIVFEVDSVIAFVAAIVLLFRDPRAKVGAKVLDASQSSADQAILELSNNMGTGFCYVPVGEGVRGVEVLPTGPTSGSRGGLPNGHSPVDTELTYGPITPPGKLLAEMFVRDSGLKTLSLSTLRASLSEAIRTDFELASSVEIQEDGERLRFVLHNPVSTCGRSDASPGAPGRVGCTMSSFFAVLACAATEQSLFLEGCSQDPQNETWTVTLRLVKTSTETVTA